MIVILDHVTPKNEEGSKEAVVKAAKGIEEDIKGLLRCVPTNCGRRRLLMILQHSRDNQRRFDGNQRPESMGDSSLQRPQYEYARRLYEPAFNCHREVHGMCLDT
jgi:hypothetical protein